MSEPITPALTPEEWETRQRGAERREDFFDYFERSWSPASFHGMAALALHGQPFGFTWAMVDDLRAYAADYADTPRLLDIADRIAALLPPRA